MSTNIEKEYNYPVDLVNWAGEGAGVRRLCDAGSGRPSDSIVETNLLGRLREWVDEIAKGANAFPRLILLVGGPGNGKTDVVDFTISEMDQKLGCRGGLELELAKAFLPKQGQLVPRIVKVQLEKLSQGQTNFDLNIVQDATVTEGCEGVSKEQALIEELSDMTGDHGSQQLYLCCINRGILDSALIYTRENKLKDIGDLLGVVTKAVSQSPNAPSCWPLEGYPEVVAWPMDSESLLREIDHGDTTPFLDILTKATTEQFWPEHKACSAGEFCPFCNSSQILRKDTHKDALSRILRWFELSAGKRWSFREIFTLVSYLLAGPRNKELGGVSDPCNWASQVHQLVEKIDENPSLKTKKNRSDAIYYLACSGYQHQLFFRWDDGVAEQLRKDLKSIGLWDQSSDLGHALMGLYYFTRDQKNTELPSSITPLLNDIIEKLDPALASPDGSMRISKSTEIKVRDLDALFSRSVQTGLDYLKKRRSLSAIENALLKRLAFVDDELSETEDRRKNPAAAKRIQRLLRDFSCRFVKRSLGVKYAVVRDLAILESYEQVVSAPSDDGHLLYQVSEEFQNLLNKNDRFSVSLNTTFGQPLPPLQKQVKLTVQGVYVELMGENENGRPHSPFRYLKIGAADNINHSQALTFDLYKALRELGSGVSAASVPPSVIAMLDTTRARLAGAVVRNESVLRGAKIQLGKTGTTIRYQRGKFVASPGGQK
ncbi:hypothetical protein [Endozoicomonas sp. ALB032]|uniref:hypothetical protein n=1 Tax=Endozoicomonas sp. ALB032 TaxID=3403082 RepID=UPI003BB65D6A